MGDGAAPGTGSRAGCWAVSEGTAAGEEMPRGPGGRCGFTMPGSTVGVPDAHPNCNRLPGVDLLLRQKYFTGGTLRVEAEKHTSAHSEARVMSAVQG